MNCYSHLWIVTAHSLIVIVHSWIVIVHSWIVIVHLWINIAHVDSLCTKLIVKMSGSWPARLTPWPRRKRMASASFGLRCKNQRLWECFSRCSGTLLGLSTSSYQGKNRLVAPELGNSSPPLFKSSQKSGRGSERIRFLRKNVTPLYRMEYPARKKSNIYLNISINKCVIVTNNCANITEKIIIIQD